MSSSAFGVEHGEIAKMGRSKPKNPRKVGNLKVTRQTPFYAPKHASSPSVKVANKVKMKAIPHLMQNGERYTKALDIIDAVA